MNAPPAMFAQTGSDPFSFLYTMRGPDFLILYGVWFLVTFGCVLLLRRSGHDNPFVSILGVVLYELPGVARYLIGSEHGLHKWLFLGLLMIIGGIIFIVRAEHFHNTGDGGGGWWSSCGGGGSSCGGGGGGCGGGGGGCGGCGGS